MNSKKVVGKHRAAAEHLRHWKQGLPHHGSEFSAAVVKAVASNAKQAANKASRILVSGKCDLTNSDSQTAMNCDRNQVDEVIRATGSKVTVKSVRRMWKTSRSSDQKASNTIPLIVEFGSEDEKITVLGNSKSLLKYEKFKKVYIRKDRTPDEQLAFSKLINEKKGGKR